jgi:nitroreductase
MTSSLPDRTALLSARYGGLQTSQSPEALARLAHPTLDTLLAHRSQRNFSAEPLAAGTLETLVAAAQSASTSSNLQCWSVVAVEDAQRKQRLSAIASNQASVRDCPLFLAWVVDLARLGQIGTFSAQEAQGLDYLEAFLVGVVDTALAAQNAAVAAESLGLGINYIGALRNDPEATAAELGLPPRSFALFGMCVGHVAEGGGMDIKPRLPQSAVLHREQYRHDGLQDAVHAYDEVMTGFYSAQAMPGRSSWSAHSLARVRDAKALRGRDVMRAALARLGFELR